MNKVAYNAVLNMFTREKDKSDLLFNVREGDNTKEDFRNSVVSTIREYFPEEKEDSVEEIAEAVIHNLLEYNVLTDLIYDPEISDIKVHDWNHIVIKRKGIHSVSDVTFESEDDYLRFIDGVITRNKVNASTQNAIQRFTDTKSIDGYLLRFTLVTTFLTTDKKYKLVIRKVATNFQSMDDLVDAQMMTPEMCEYLKGVWNEGSVLVCGANASGKTTFLNALKEEIAPDKSVLVIQQAEELTTKSHPDMLFLHSFEGVGENAVRYDLKDLSIAGLTLDIDFFIIGEVKGAEAAYLLNASYTGSVCGATVHANSSQTALDKIVDYALYSSSYSKPELMAMLAGFKTIVFIKDFRIREISHVNGVKNGQIDYDFIYKD